MSSPRKDWARQILERVEVDAEGWHCCAGLDKTTAEMLLDWLEGNGYGQREVSSVEDGSFTVRWRR